MRSRKNSALRLDYFQRIVYKTILSHQDPVTGLLPSSQDNDHAWVRDNVYSILAVWGLALAYKKNQDYDEDCAKAYELEQRCVKLMRGLLTSMMRQIGKLNKFKASQNPIDALHAKYCARTGATVVGDTEWGHLQLDATSLFLLILSQMTASGLQIVFNVDEVAFIQNLVFYIESAYCIPDYGVWERGDKTNHGLPELNASSIGMAKAALEALSELDLFGSKGGPGSVIHVLTDEAIKCHAVLQSMLPRESSSKEVDGALLSVIGFPAFAVDDPELIKFTRTTVVDKLQGRYGLKRFLRDGYKTAKEDARRLYYEPWELRVFENIENEWPLFYCYLILEYAFHGDWEAVNEYMEALEDIAVRGEDGLLQIPEMYMVPEDHVNQEYQDPHSQDRIAVGKLPFMWAQSLYILGCLLNEQHLAVGEIDPLNRRLGSEKKPDVVVQVVILAENKDIQDALRQYDIQVQTVEEASPVEIQTSRVLSHLYSYLGHNKKLKLSGRQSRDVGILTTSKLYTLQDRLFAFTPQFIDHQRFYLASDFDLLTDMLCTEMNFLSYSWRNMLGRPLLVMTIKSAQLENDRIPNAMVTTLKKLKSGYANGTRVTLGNIQDFLSTSCITDLNFLGNSEDGMPDSLTKEVKEYLEQHLHKTWIGRPPIGLAQLYGGKRRKSKFLRRRLSVRGSIKRTRSIAVEPGKGLPVSLQSPDSDARAASPAPFLVVPTLKEPTASSQDEDDEEEPEEEEHWHLGAFRSRTMSETYKESDISELLSMLKDATHLEEQGDILHFLVENNGLHYETGVTHENGSPVTVRDHVKELYDKACHQKHWSLVRHTAGMLSKRVEDLSKSVTDLLVRQKQVTVGMPGSNEQTIIAPLPPTELRHLIHEAYGGDESSAVLTQELLVYLAMFIRTEPGLFSEMLRLRIGLIIQVMASELSRALRCTAEEATDHLMNLSPFEMKNLLHHILSGKEFGIGSAPGLGLRRKGSDDVGQLLGLGRRGSYIESDPASLLGLRRQSTFDMDPSHIPHLPLRRKSSTGSVHVATLVVPGQVSQSSSSKHALSMSDRKRSVADSKPRSGHLSLISNRSGKVSKKSQMDHLFDAADTSDVDRQGQWLRRRRLDGALNRCPQGFYKQMWLLLERCRGLAIEGQVLPQTLTQEMTPGELKFAVHVETVLNTIPDPEYRQLMVESIMVLSLVVEYNVIPSLGGIINVQQILHKANSLFLEDQQRIDGDATLCCAAVPPRPCDGAFSVCTHFYDSAPSGCYGTMTYLIRAASCSLECLPRDGDIDCAIS